MSYFPCDIPYMSDEELKANGIKTTQDVQKCDTCKHEKEPWSNGCADCFDYELWEGKTDDQD